jgi:CMP-N-acetylneuraminic acid synthetase
MNVLAVILARAGSAGLKNKHLLPLLGKPVINYTFEHARAAQRLTRVVVSSDSPDVLRLAAASKLQTLNRPATLATAEASVQSVLLHALQSVEAQGGFRADAIVTLYGNVPVRPEGVIDQALAMLAETRCDSVRSFCPVGKWHPDWMARIAGDRVMPLRAASIHRRQDLEPLFLHDGAVVACSRESLERGLRFPADPHAFFGSDRRAVLTRSGDTVEIDQLTDLFLAEAALRHRQGDRAEPAVRQAS